VKGTKIKPGEEVKKSVRPERIDKEW